mmetsp:Transcript_28525/g.51202  ORF Transcript_28525/g.51202 Transcript_28525/m.51202 type:complete len:96 (+) Transcript_28525:48-335(+)
MDLSPKQQKLMQKMAEVDPKKQKAQKQASFNLWRKMNPGYSDYPISTTNRDQYGWNPEDFKDVDREFAHKRDKESEYIEYLIRDQHLSRGASKNN